MKDIVIHLCILTIMCTCYLFVSTCICIYNVMYNLSFMFYFYLGSKNDEKKEKKKESPVGSLFTLLFLIAISGAHGEDKSITM